MGFRPQQGLPIMNSEGMSNNTHFFGFRPQQGLPIMNIEEKYNRVVSETCFRPQQGLPIMNKSETGATYYESLPTKP